jgi:ABC-type uncharacterized transport system auxiliary subunit
MSLVAATMLAGCAGMQGDVRPTVWLALEPRLPQGSLRAGGPTLEVGRFAAASPFDTDRVATREGASRWTFAVYHRWTAPPGEMVAARLRDALGRADLFGAVFTPPAPIDADYRLGGAVRALWWDREARSAVIEIEAALIAAPDRLRGFWVRRAAVPAAGDTVEAFLAAGSEALAQVIAELGKDVAGAIAEPARSIGPDDVGARAAPPAAGPR